MTEIASCAPRQLAADLGRMGLDTHRVSNKVSKITSRHLVPLDRAFPAHALLHESSRARTMPTDRILTCRCDTTLVGRGRSSDSGSHSRGRPHPRCARRPAPPRRGPQWRVSDPATGRMILAGEQNAIAATFRHDTSRNCDPQLHPRAGLEQVGCWGRKDPRQRTVRDHSMPYRRSPTSTGPKDCSGGVK